MQCIQSLERRVWYHSCESYERGRVLKLQMAPRHPENNVCQHSIVRSFTILFYNNYLFRGNTNPFALKYISKTTYGLNTVVLMEYSNLNVCCIIFKFALFIYF